MNTRVTASILLLFIIMPIIRMDRMMKINYFGLYVRRTLLAFSRQRKKKKKEVDTKVLTVNVMITEYLHH